MGSDFDSGGRAACQVTERLVIVILYLVKTLNPELLPIGLGSVLHDCSLTLVCEWVSVRTL